MSSSSEKEKKGAICWICRKDVEDVDPSNKPLKCNECKELLVDHICILRAQEVASIGVSHDAYIFIKKELLPQLLAKYPNREFLCMKEDEFNTLFKDIIEKHEEQK